MTRSRCVIVAFALIASLLVVGAQPAAATHQLTNVSVNDSDTDFASASLTNMSITGSGDSATVGIDSGNVTVDSFEDGSLSEYVGDTTDFTVDSAFAIDGTDSLKRDGTGFAEIVENDELDHPAAGDTFEVYIRAPDDYDAADTADFRFYFGVQSETSLPDRYQVGFVNGDTLELFKEDSGSSTLDSTAVSIDGGTWYRFSVDWTVSGDITATVYNDTSGAQVGQVSATDTTFSSGGIGFQVNNQDTNPVYFDHYQIVAEEANTPAEYVNNHSANDTELGFVDVTTANNVSFNVTWSGDTDGDGTYETTLNETTGLTTAANHTFTWSEFAAADVQVDIDVTSTGTDEAFVLEREGVQARGVASTIDNGSATPTGDLQTTTPTLEIDVNDSDFSRVQTESLTVKYFVDGSFDGTDTLSANGTSSHTVSTSLTGGDHTWSVAVVDEYGHNVSSSTFSISTPGNITIRNVTEPHDIIQSASADIILAGSNETVDRQTVTDGNVSMAGLPTDESYILVIEADNYHRRTVIVEDIFSQSDVYLLNTSFSSIENTFNIDDQTGQFEGDETEIIIQKPINRSKYDSTFAAEYQWVDVAGDRIGADGSYTVDLEEGDRYRIIVDNNNGDRRILGEYQAEAGGVVTLRIGELTFDIGPDGETYEYSGSFTSSAVKFNYTDPDNDTTSLTVKIFEAGNESNEIYNDTETGEIGTVGISEPISGAEVNTTWVVEFTGTRGGEAIDGRVVVGASGLAPGVPLSDAWKNRIAFSLLLIITGLTAGGFNAETGSLVAALTGGILWWTGWLPAEIGGGVVALALFVAGAMTLSTRGGEEIQ